MGKIGRNDPCPCGSGKKYKKCCLPLDEEAKRNSAENPDESAHDFSPPDTDIWEEPVDPVSAGLGDDIPLRPYAIVKIAENPGADLLKDAKIRRSWKKFIGERWTIAKVAAMTTEEITAQLEHYGVPFSRENFLGRAEGRYSAWDISDDWLSDYEVNCKRNEDDFLGLAACELWKRLIPERPSMEMLDDWMQEGYDLSEKRRDKEACDIWFKTWKTLRERFKPEMTMMSDTAPVFSGLQSIFNWCQDFETELRNVARKHPEYASRGLEYCRELLEQFPEEEESIQVNFREAMANFYFILGKTDEGLSALNEIVEKCPKNLWGYIYLADAHGHVFDRDNGVPLDLAKAEKYLDQALKKANLGYYGREMIEDRRELLRKGGKS